MDGCLNQRALVLNRLWQPVNIITVPRAFALIFQEHAKVIHSNDGSFQVMSAEEWMAFSASHPSEDCVHTVRLSIRIPRVLLLTFYDKLPLQEIRFNRQNLFERDGYTCQYCGNIFTARDLNLDHVIPRDRGGQTTWENIATSCTRCNSRKANRLPHEAGMRLIRKPARPPWRPFVTLTAGEDVHEDWTHFMQSS
ncbi:MAG: HNH endonuclease [Verrucomicrobiota bacterium]|nr:HNH endonuclease [Verrucomicrobiota bacterium]